jgi:hypothetical protein
MNRRMDSSSSWLSATDETSTANSDGDGDNDDNNSNSEALSPVPHQGKTQPTTLSYIASEKRRKRNKMDNDDENSPQSLPFLRDTNLDIAEMILEEELRARSFNNSNNTWQYDDVVNFFRGLYVYGKCYSSLLRD